MVANTIYDNVWVQQGDEYSTIIQVLQYIP